MTGHGDGGERRCGVLGRAGVAETDNSYIARDSEPRGASGVERGQRHLIVGREESSWGVFVEQTSGRRETARIREVAIDDEVGSEASSGHRGPKARLALEGGAPVTSTADEADSLVPETDEIVGHIAR